MGDQIFQNVHIEFKKQKQSWDSFKLRLTEVPYVSLEDYFSNLEKWSREVNELEAPKKMIFLAAAVSDFTCKSKTSKIDSSEDFSSIELEKVPKLISTLTGTWAPTVSIFSFKLETDEEKIVKKAQKYFSQGVAGVIGNELLTRRYKVILILRDKTEEIFIKEKDDYEIETVLVQKLLNL